MTETSWTIGAHGESKFCWVHLDGHDEKAMRWLDTGSEGSGHGLPPTARFNLTTAETRPRCQPLDGGVIINLRGPRAHAEEEGDELVSIRIWAERGRIVSVTYRRLAGLEQLRVRMDKGEFLDPGDLIAALAVQISHQLDPVIAELGDQVDDCELSLSSEHFHLRREIAHARSKAISYRRFIVPQRQALEAMALLEQDWIEDEDRIHLREAADRFARMAEELEAVRERSALLHEQITDLRAEKIDRRSLVIAIVAMIFLPLTFVTGLFGMNVDGIPYAHHPLSFWAVTGFSLLVGASVAIWFAVANWFRN
ncbi:zinc transporter ZntB [Rhizorhabdus dicambivorans]|uniref:Zinc transporter ZntB n=1 Tax=Rhizorhabdus dicambivorans TaxID=1850238 RepID=A0A2A4G0J2_9SPHN|nr:zinc transporter ZntB [Rhizorhabdus dicambivorans]ATE63301.1 zinc transporter ZntB [Rhizorhabdus dicambivorans]PCE43515.1 zinc transporter ZntB [Rhizorhabdus dicambivorans]